MNYEEFDEKYKVIYNPNNKETQLFETFGDDLQFVSRQNKLKIWTVVEGDDGELYIVHGYHYVNRVGYLITENHPEKILHEFCIPYN